MNYDLILYRSLTGEPDLSEAEELEEQAINDEGLDMLSSRNHHEPKEIECSDTLREMTRALKADEPDVTSEDRVMIHLPYNKKGSGIENLFATTQTYLEKLADQGGYFVYDPQASKAFDPKVTQFDWTEVYQKGAEMIDEIKAEAFDL